MSEPSTHPSHDELAAFGLGQLLADAAAVVERHVSECDTCCETIADLSSGDTFLDLVREAGKKLPADQTAAHDSVSVDSSSALPSVPTELAEHARYEALSLIGKGGMGDVYKARHRKMERIVALKVINRGLIRKPEAVNRFHREVKTAAQLSHPNIVTSHDADQAGDYHFMVMEYVDGVDLSQITKERGAVPVVEACDYIRQAAIGLQYAHEQGMVHRDIKPHNLMVTADRTVKILDFGLASLAPDLTSCGDNKDEVHSNVTTVGTIMGTPDFISPEQAKDARKVDIRSDIYSLGGTLYFLLSGRAPFAEGSVMHKLQSHAQVKPESLQTLRNDIPAELDQIVSRMMAKDPNERFQTPAEVAAALVNIGQALVPSGEEIQSSQTPKREPLVQPARRKAQRFYLTAIAAIFFGLACAATLFFVQTNNGTVSVRVSDPSLAVRFSDQTIRVADGKREFTIGAGEQKQLVVKQDGSDFELVTESFLIRRRGDVALEVDIVDGEVVVTKNEMPFDQQTLPESDLDSKRAHARTAQMRDVDTVPRRGTQQQSDHHQQFAEQEHVENQSPIKWMLETDPSLRQQIAESLLQKGNVDEARQTLATIPQMSPEAQAALDLAKIREQQGEFEKAADSYLEAYRLQPTLLSLDHMRVIKKGNRVHQLVDVLTEERLTQLGYANDAEKLIRALLKEKATREDGYELLKRVWSALPRSRFSLLENRPDEIWKDMPDPVSVIRVSVFPQDVAAEGGGWERFGVSAKGARGGTATGVPENLRPLLDALQQPTPSLRNLADDVEADVSQHPQWKAGVALLGFLEAELGNEKRAVALFEQVLAEKDNPITPESAWIFGLGLEGKSKDLDQIVVRLYEINVDGERDSNEALRESAIGALARLYARYDRRDEARQLLLRLTKPEGVHYGEQSEWVVCSWARGPRGTDPINPIPQSDRRCVECHRAERNLENYILMANGLTDIGFPVEARLALGRIGASFYNAYDSDEVWAKANTSVPDWEFQGEEAFQPARAKAEGAITPLTMLHALESGVTIESDLKKCVIAESASQIDLMLGVRGENGKSTLFSPVIDMLEIAANAKGDKAAIANVKIDQLLAEAFDKNPDNVEAGIAATTFAFLRNDLESAEKRLQKLEQLVDRKESQAADLSLWLVARLALATESTEVIGEKFADRALTAAGKQPDPLWKEAIHGARELK